MQIGQAIRIAQLDGLHTELPGNELGIQTVTRCRNLWWTLYVMDRHVSSSLGLPMTTQDSDITTELNPAGSRSRPDATLSLHVKLSYLFSTILTCKSPWLFFVPIEISHLPRSNLQKRENRTGHIPGENEVNSTDNDGLRPRDREPRASKEFKLSGDNAQRHTAYNASLPPGKNGQDI